MRGSTIGVAALALALAGCGGGAASGGMMPTPPPADPGSPVTHEGTVIVSGVEGLVDLRLDTDAGQIGLVGGWVDEIKNLSGARVSVRGDGRDEAFEVRGYTVVEVNGERPWVGVVLSYAGGFRLDGPDPVGLTGESARLQELVGSKIWVTGPRSGDGVQVVSFGVIRPAAR